MSFWENKCVVVAGGAGFLGTAVVEILQQKSCRKIFVPRKNQIGTGQEIRIKALWEIIKREVGYCGEVEWNHHMPDGQPRRCLDVSAMKGQLQFFSRNDIGRRTQEHD